MASLDTTRLDPAPLPRRPPATADRVAHGALTGGVVGGLAGLVLAGDADAFRLGLTALAATYAGLGGGAALGWAAGLAGRRTGSSS